MKYKILINGRNNALVVDFIQRTEMFFDTLSTSDCWQDIVGHFSVFDPKAYVCFVEPDYEKTVKQINALKTSGVYNGAVIVLIGDGDTCDAIEENSRFTADIIIRRPVTPDNLALKITRYFEEVNEAKERIRKREEAKLAA